jgi:hypothetical protein
VRLARAQITVRQMMVAVALLATLLCAHVLALRPEYHRVTVVNESGQSIGRLIVTVNGYQALVTDLADDSTASVPFPVHGNDCVDLTGRFGNGTGLRTGFTIVGNPRRLAYIACKIGLDGKLRLSLRH